MRGGEGRHRCAIASRIIAASVCREKCDVCESVLMYNVFIARTTVFRLSFAKRMYVCTSDALTTTVIALISRTTTSTILEAAVYACRVSDWTASRSSSDMSPGTTAKESFYPREPFDDERPRGFRRKACRSTEGRDEAHDFCGYARIFATCNLWPVIMRDGTIEFLK